MGTYIVSADARGDAATKANKHTINTQLDLTRLILRYSEKLICALRRAATSALGAGRRFVLPRRPSVVVVRRL
jgi:hypothetical protein